MTPTSRWPGPGRCLAVWRAPIPGATGSPRAADGAGRGTRCMVLPGTRPAGGAPTGRCLASGSSAPLSRGRGRSGGGWRVREARERLLPARRGKDLPMNDSDFIQNIRLDRLVKSPRNVRKTPSSEAADAELKASIAVHGLQQNLVVTPANGDRKSEEHTSELQSLMRISYAVFCLT